MGKRLNLKRRGSEAFAKVEKKLPPSQPGLELGSLAYEAEDPSSSPGWDSGAFFSTFTNVSLPLLFRNIFFV